jgi:branched-chain amino acid transport system substrate-binding protein
MGPGAANARHKAHVADPNIAMNRKDRSKPARLTVVRFFLFLLFAFSIPNCSQQQNPNGPDHSRIKIGFFGDLSGPTFNFGDSAKNGVIMAADEINLGGGIEGRRIDVVIDDDGGSPEKAATLAGQLIDNDKVVAIIAAGTSQNSRAASPKAQSSKIPLIAPSSTDPAVTQVGDYIFRACLC